MTQKLKLFVSGKLHVLKQCARGCAAAPLPATTECRAATLRDGCALSLRGRGNPMSCVLHISTTTDAARPLRCVASRRVAAARSSASTCVHPLATYAVSRSSGKDLPPRVKRGGGEKRGKKSSSSQFFRFFFQFLGVHAAAQKESISTFLDLDLNPLLL